MDRDEDVEVVGVEAEVVDLVPAPGELRTLAQTQPGALPALRTAAVAATGFIAGAATVVLLRRAGVGRRATDLPEFRSARERAVPGFPQMQAGSMRTYLVTVRMISRP